MPAVGAGALRLTREANDLMFARLMPRERRFYELFDAHAEHIVRGSRELEALMSDLGEMEVRTHNIDEIERAADKVTRDTIRLLHRTFITPLDTDDIRGLINAMDDILDLIQSVSESLQLYDIRRITPDAQQLARICRACAERLQTAVGALAQLKDPEGLLKICHEIDLLESDADRVMRSAMSRLFRDEADVRQVLKLKAIYELLEAVTDRCEDVANIIEGIVLESA